MIKTHSSSQSVAIIGGGPAGLMAAEVLSLAGVRVDLYDAMPSVGRKFLMAGKGGMNISHSEPFEQFVQRYGDRQSEIEAMLRAFGPKALREWVHGLGIETFVGSSGRVFPTDMKAAPLLRAWLHRLRENGVNIHVRHRWLGWQGNDAKALRFATPDGEKTVFSDAVVLALGGGSWAKLGSTGAWVELLNEKQIAVVPLKPSNCGFNVDWSEHFRSNQAGQPLKNVIISAVDTMGKRHVQTGEFNITGQGLEGGLIYALSGPLRDRIERDGKAEMKIDLLPDQSQENLTKKLSRPRGKNSWSNHLRKCCGLKGGKVALLREQSDVESWETPEHLAALIKDLSVTLLSPRPIDEAISSAGGVEFAALDQKLMLQAMPGVFCAGEMVDWEAPTGGYLLTACFASGFVAGKGVLSWLENGAEKHS